MSHALVPLPSAPLVNIDEIRSALVAMREKANLLSPVASLDYIPPMHRISFRQVLIDASLSSVRRGDRDIEVGTDTYRDKRFCAENERALSKVGIMRLFNAAGIDLVNSYRMDDGKDPFYVNWRVICRVPQLDGKVQTFVGSKIIDLRIDSPLSKSMKGAQRDMMAQKILENAETKALLRVARAALNLRQVYNVADLEKPFVLPVLVPDLDTSDPEIKRMVAANALGLNAALYGGAPMADTSIPMESTPDGVMVPAIATPDGEPVDDEVEEEVADILPLPQAAPPAVAEEVYYCECPCNHRASITKAVSEATTREGGSARCRSCWPARNFNYETHKHLHDLGLNRKISPAQAREMR